MKVDKDKIMFTRGKGRPPLPRRVVIVRKLRKQYAGMIILGLLFLSVAMSGFYFGLHAHGASYVYNLSKNESDQIVISELCYAGIDIGECNELYGSIENKHYGEPVENVR